MLFEDTYKTLALRSEGLYKERGSKFIGLAIPVSSELAVKEELEKVKKTYHDARHHCYAYRLGWDHSAWRMNDDGEPSGTAGKPIFGRIRSYELTNVFLVVVRYFGGVKLGVRGLINAYKGTAEDAINNNKIIEKTVNEHLRLNFAYPQMGEVMHIINEENLPQFNMQFELECQLDVNVRRLKAEEIISKLENIRNVTVSRLGLV